MRLNFLVGICISVQLDTQLKLDACNGKVQYRPNVLGLTPDQWNRFADAVKMIHGDEDALNRRIQVVQNSQIESKTKSKVTEYLESLKVKDETIYDQLVRVHIQHYNSYHNSTLFLPWHRAYILLFERELRSVDPDVKLPYWDFTIYHEYLLGDPALNSTRYGNNGNPDDGFRIDGEFRDFQGYFHWDKNGYRPITRRDDFTFFHPVSSLALVINYFRTADFNFFTKHLEASVHGSLHQAIGQEFFEVSSPNDPLFFSYHAFIDKLWFIWQKMHKFNHGENDYILEPFGIKVQDVIYPDKKVCSIYRNTHIFYNGTVQGIPKEVFDRFKKFEFQNDLTDSTVKQFNVILWESGYDPKKINVEAEELDNEMYDEDIINSDHALDAAIDEQATKNPSNSFSTFLALISTFIFAFLHLI